VGTWLRRIHTCSVEFFVSQLQALRFLLDFRFRPAGPGVVAKPEASGALVQQAGYYKRRWRYRNGTYVRASLTAVDDVDGDTWVRAPFARVYSGRRGSWVRAPFVNLWIPR
jgi:hypothetical protein